MIRKNRPEWQAGRLNGVGGKVETTDADGHAAMVREFTEETGVLVPTWHHFASLTWEEGVVRFFRAFAPLDTLKMCRTVTGRAHRSFPDPHPARSEPVAPGGDAEPAVACAPRRPPPRRLRRGRRGGDGDHHAQARPPRRHRGRLMPKLDITCEFCRRRPVVVRVSARGDVGRSSTYSCRECATDWNRDNGAADVEIVALPGRAAPVVEGTLFAAGPWS